MFVQLTVSGLNDHTLKVWDLDTRKLKQTLEGHPHWVNAVALSPDSKLAVSASLAHSLKVWDLQNGKQIACFIGESFIITCAIASDRFTIVAGDASGRVHFLRLEGIDK